VCCVPWEMAIPHPATQVHLLTLTALCPCLVSGERRTGAAQKGNSQIPPDFVVKCQAFDGPDHGVGHLASMTAPDNQRLDIVQGCNTRTPSPSLAMDLHPDSGLRRRRERWAPSFNISNVAMMIAINAGTASNALSGVSGMAIYKP